MNRFGLRLLTSVCDQRGITARPAQRFRSTLHRNSFTMTPAISQSRILPVKVPARKLQTSVTLWHYGLVDLSKDHCILWDEFKDGVENDKVLLIDVRRQAQVDKGRVPAKRYINVPLGELEDALEMTDEEFKQEYGADKPDKDAEDIVFFCRLGIRSSRAVKLAEEAGYKSPRHYPGGWAVWKERIRSG